MADPKYGAAHQRLRKQWAQKIANGARPICPRCSIPIEPRDEWDLDHAEDGVNYLGPSHRRECNRSAGGKKARANDRARKSWTVTENIRSGSRDWG